MRYNNWINELTNLIPELEQMDLGFPLGEHIIRDAADPAHIRELESTLEPEITPDACSQLVSLYELADGVDLPDVHVGYFIYKCLQVAKGLRKGQPTRLRSETDVRIIVFGADGGGGRFAIRTGRQTDVVYLPMAGVYDQVYNDIDGDVIVIAASLDEFFEKLVEDVRAFVREDKNWIYIAR